MNDLTELQLKLLEYYRNYIKEHKVYPMLGTVAEYFSVTYQTITQRLDSLVNKGYMTKIRRGAYIPTSKK